MRIEVLGPSRMSVDGAFRNLPAGVGGMLLQALVLRPNQVVDADTLASALWSGDQHRLAARLRVVASRLRSGLNGRLVVEAASGGYRLRASTSSLDRLEFEALARRAFDGDVGAARAALRLWRGVPFGGFVETPTLQGQRVELLAIRDRLRMLADEADSTENDGPTPTKFRPTSAPSSARPHPWLKHLPPVGDVRLITAIAPARSGKTLLLAQWAALEAGRIGWLHLRGEENDPSTFWYSLGSAFASVAPSVLVAHPAGPDGDSEHLLAYLLNGLLQCDTAIGVVVDGFQVITNPRIHQQLDTFLRRCSSGHTIAIASQKPLPLRTSRLYASHDMVAVGDDHFSRSAGMVADGAASHDRRVRYDQLGDAVGTASAHGDSDSVRRLLTAAEPQIALASPVVRDVCLPAAALLGPDQRRRWLDAAFQIGNRDAAIAAAEAVDLYRMGRCHESLATAESALPTCETPASRHPQAMLAATAVACRIMLNLPVAPYRDQHSGWSMSVPAAWPWLTRWELGQRALLAFVRDDYLMAQVLVEDAALILRGLHSSWRELADGISVVMSTLLDSARARTRADQRRLAHVLDAVIRRADGVGHTPLGIVARYVAWLVHLRADNHDAATTRLAEADARHEPHSELLFLLDVRNRLTNWRAMPVPPSELDRLSARERQVLPYLATDLTVAKIAEQLYLSPHTVRSHVRSIYSKLGVQRRAQAIRYANQTNGT